MASSFLRISFRIGLTGIAVAAVTGCGQPNLPTMKPSVWKPSAEVFLVNNPPGWRGSDVLSQAAAVGVTARVAAVTDAGLARQFAQAVQSTGIGLLVVVENGPIQDSVVEIARQHIDRRFEFIGVQSTSTTASLSSVNVREIVPSPLDMAYMLGWVAGQLAIAQGSPDIGWTVDGTTSMTRQDIQVALAGAYAASQTVSMLPVNLAAPGGGGLPRVVVVQRPLTAAEASTLAQNGSLIVSMVPQSVLTGISAQAVVPAQDILSSDLQAFARLGWTAGQITPFAPSMLQLDQVTVPRSVQTLADSLGQSLAASQGFAVSSWAGVPSNLQQLWTPIVAAGS